MRLVEMKPAHWRSARPRAELRPFLVKDVLLGLRVRLEGSEAAVWVMVARVERSLWKQDGCGWKGPWRWSEG